MSLTDLSERLGIFPYYWDIGGVQHWTTHEDRVKILSVLGYPAETDEQASDQLSRLNRHAALEVCPPVIVLRPGQTPVIPLRVPQPLDGGPHFELLLENGASLLGKWQLQQLQQIEACEIDGSVISVLRFELPRILSLGYHSVKIKFDHLSTEHETLLMIAPEQCYLPAADLPRRTRKMWGISAQLYRLSKGTAFGVGDFGQLAALCETVADAGGDFVGLNPLHSLSAAGETEISPYSPSSRVAVNPIYLDIASAARTLGYAVPRKKKYVAPKDGQIDYAAAQAEKQAVCEKFYEKFFAERPGTAKKPNPAWAQFEEFRLRSGQALQRYAVFCALHAQFRKSDPSIWGWHLWPVEFHHPASEAVVAYAEQHEREIGFHLFVQWLCAAQLQGIRARCAELGMGIGLYLDIALGSRSGGADSWMYQELYASGVSMGAPPDELAPQGQDWGLPPMIPQALRASRFASFIAAVRTTMQYAGAVRIDHVMSLFRLYWVTGPGSGAYVKYPLEELVAIVSIESVRNRTIVIGEDLGTVPDEVRAAMQAHAILSYKVFIFMKDMGGSFHPASEYPSRALVTASTHDLPTMRGFFTGWDMIVRERLNLHEPEVLDRLRSGRDRDRREILALFKRLGNLDWLHAEGIPRAMSNNPDAHFGNNAALDALSESVHSCMADTDCLMMAVQLEDICGEFDQVNLPGTVHEHPNWRIAFPVSVDELPQLEAWQRLTSLAAQKRR